MRNELFRKYFISYLINCEFDEVPISDTDSFTQIWSNDKVSLVMLDYRNVLHKDLSQLQYLTLVIMGNANPFGLSIFLDFKDYNIYLKSSSSILYIRIPIDKEIAKNIIKERMWSSHE